MTSLLPSLPISFPRSPPSWYILPRKHKSPSSTTKISLLSESMRDDQELPTQVDLETEASLSTGEQHWEAERKAWLAGPGSADNMDDDPFITRLRSSSEEKLIRHYKEIVNSVRPFRQKISLSDLIPILVAGWKDAGLWPTEESLREDILQKHLNPDDYDLKVHLSGILDSDEPIDKEVDIALARLLAKQNALKKV